MLSCWWKRLESVWRLLEGLAIRILWRRLNWCLVRVTKGKEIRKKCLEVEGMMRDSVRDHRRSMEDLFIAAESRKEMCTNI